MNLFSQQEIRLFKRLSTPAKVQDFLNLIPANHERDGKDTVKSPLRVLRENSAHCIEAAILGAYILSLSGHRPLLLHLETVKTKRNGKLIDQDHVVAPFKIDGLWGALSKTNHAVLRYREPAYQTIRELAMSYFHEYFTDDGTKTLRRYSKPLDLSIFEENWPTAEDDLWGIDEELDRIVHYQIAPASTVKSYRKADEIERRVGKITEWQ